MERGQWSNVVTLPIVIPGNYLQKLWAHGQNLVPTTEPQEIRWEHPILAVRDFLPEF
jgi:hypothetical protein